MSKVNARRLRLAQIVTRMDIGGVPDHIMTLIRELHREFDITVICGSIDDAHRSDLVAMNVAIVTIPFRRLISPLTDIKTFLALRSLNRTHKFDIVHTHMSKAALIGSIAAAWTRVPAIVNTAHNLGFVALPNRVLRLLFWVYDFLLFRAAVDTVITVSTKVRDRIIETRMLPAERVVAVHNGMSIEKLAASQCDADARRAEFGVSGGGVLIVSVARLVWFKGLNTLIDAMPSVLARCPEARFVVAGDGLLRQELTDQAQRLGVANQLLLVGERRDIASILAASDVFVLPSVSEGLPISIMEAMAVGRPVVATDVGGVAELVLHEETGLLVPPRASEALADALVRLALDPALRHVMGARGRGRIDAEFAASHMAQCTVAVYRDILTRKSRRG